MFSKLVVLFVTAAAIASATPAPQAGDETNKCNVGKLECCKSVQAPKDKSQQSQLGALNLALGTAHALLGVQCNPISGLIGLGTASNCNAQPVCCDKNVMNGLVVVGCSPINVNV